MWQGQWRTDGGDKWPGSWGVRGHNSSTGNLITASSGEQEHAVYLIEIVEIINQKCSLKASVHNSCRKHMSVLP